MIGEIGVFSPHKARIATAVAVTPVEVLAIAEDRVIALYNDNREFGFYLVTDLLLFDTAGCPRLPPELCNAAPAVTTTNLPR